MRKLVGKGSRKCSTPFGRVGDIIQHPRVWAGVAAVLAVFGPKGRRAAVRGAACYLDTIGPVATDGGSPGAVVGTADLYKSLWISSRRTQPRGE
ncbi:MAG: hypothetical protein KY458_12555 [Actinobacteria bacterium]|nr:hypothetical protein [Actinomycetota bacterium]